VPDQVRQVILFRTKSESLDVANALAQDDAVFGKMAAQCVHQLGALTNEQIAGAKEHRAGLLRGTLHRHHSHGRSLDRLGNRFRIRGIVLLPLHEGFDIDGRDEPDVMAEPAEFPAPVVRGPAGLHGHEARRQRCHELRELWPGQFLAENCASVRRSAMNLEDLLCQVDADDANLIHGCLLSLW